MKRTVLSALVAGSITGAALTALLLRPEAQAQRPETAARWEYKVIYVAGAAPAVSEQLDNMSAAMNKSAADGWEYAGLVATEPGKSLSPAGYVAFRRPKK